MATNLGDYYHDDTAVIHVFGVKVPAAIAPRVAASVNPTADGWRVDVIVTWRGALVCRYGGTIRPA